MVKIQRLNLNSKICCIFWPAFGCCTLQMLVEIFVFRIKNEKKEKRKNEFHDNIYVKRVTPTVCFPHTGINPSAWHAYTEAPADLLNRSNRASINRFLFIDQNDKGHVSASAGVCLYLWQNEAKKVSINFEMKNFTGWVGGLKDHSKPHISCGATCKKLKTSTWGRLKAPPANPRTYIYW